MEDKNFNTFVSRKFEKMVKENTKKDQEKYMRLYICKNWKSIFTEQFIEDGRKFCEVESKKERKREIKNLKDELEQLDVKKFRLAELEKELEVEKKAEIEKEAEKLLCMDIEIFEEIKFDGSVQTVEEASFFEESIHQEPNESVADESVANESVVDESILQESALEESMFGDNE